MIESLYKIVFKEEVNFMLYCNYMYFIFGLKISCEMFLKWKRGYKLMFSDCEYF